MSHELVDSLMFVKYIAPTVIVACDRKKFDMSINITVYTGALWSYVCCNHFNSVVSLALLL